MILPGLHLVTSVADIAKPQAPSIIDVGKEELEDFWEEEKATDAELRYHSVVPIDLTAIGDGHTVNICSAVYRNCSIVGIRLRGVKLPGLRRETGLLVSSIQCHGMELLNGAGRMSVEHLDNLPLTWPGVVKAGECIRLTVQAVEVSPANAVVGCYLVEYLA